MEQDLLLLKVHKAAAEGKDYYDAFRGNWRISNSRIEHIKYVVGVCHGKIVCVFQPTSWNEIDEGP